jgi:iron complex outermembrane receptor protein
VRKLHMSAVAAATTIVLTSAATAARAQEAAEAAAPPMQMMEEIVVTAQKREEKLQDVPLSVAAFTGVTLQQAGVDNVTQLTKLVPNMNINRGTQVSNLRMVVRGVGSAGNSGIDPSIGTFVDGIYVPRPGALVGSFNDMGGVEVLRGPQGTLFGRNATVGGILFRTADPTSELGGNVEVQMGKYGMQRYTAVLNLPMSDTLSLRMSGLHDSTDGYTRNDFDGQTYGARDTTAGRLAMKWDITENLNWTLKVDSSKIGGDGYQPTEIDPKTLTATSTAILTGFTGGNPPDLTDPFDGQTNQLIYGHLNDRQWGVASNFTWDLDSGYTIRLLSGYRDWTDRQLDGDVVWTVRDLSGRTGSYDSKSQSYELQLISPTDKLWGGRFDYVAGLYYFQEDFSIGESLSMGSMFCNVFLPAPARPGCNASTNKDEAAVSTFTQDASNYAVYAQGNFALTDTLTAVLGGRWTNDDKTGSYEQAINNNYVYLVKFRSPESQQLKNSDSDFTYRAGLNFKPNEDLLLFASYSTGYKSGGFNSGAGYRAPTLPPQDRVFSKETSDSLEAGVKATLADGRAHVNVTAFLMNLKDFQDRAFDGTTFNVINAGNMRNQGLEADADWAVTDNLRLFGTFGYLDAEFSKYPNASCLPYPAQLDPTCVQDLKGKRPVYAAKYQGSAGLQLEGDFGSSVGYLFRTDVSYTGDNNLNSVNDNNPQGIQPAYTLVSARFSLMFGEDRNYTLSVFGDNLTDEGYCTNKVAQVLDNTLGLRDPVTGGTVMRCGVASPRTYGFSIKAQF